MVSTTTWYQMSWVSSFSFGIFFCHGFLSQTLTIHRTAREGREPPFFLSTTSSCSRTYRYLFATYHVRWLPHIFKRIACSYQTATWWDLPPWGVTNWLVDDGMLISVCLYDVLQANGLTKSTSNLLLLESQQEQMQVKKRLAKVLGKAVWAQRRLDIRKSW